MATLSDEQVEYILADIKAHGIRLQSLQDNLLDHICILVEERLEAGGDFGSSYAGIVPSFYKNELYELEEEALFLESLRRPHLLLSRGWFFVCAFAMVLAPWIAYVGRWWLVLRPMGDYRTSFDIIGGACVLDLYPLLTVFVLFLTPNQFDPLIPWQSKILLGTRPLIRVLPDPAG